MAIDYEQVSKDALSSARLVHDAVVGMLRQYGTPAFLAEMIAGFCGGLILVGRGLYIALLFVFVSVGTTLVTAVLQVIKSIRQDGAADFAEVTGEALGEFMAIDTKEVTFAVGSTPEAGRQRAIQLGNLFVGMMQEQFGQGGVQSPDDGEKAAKALAGYGINFATSNTFLSWMIELGTDGKFADFDKLGEEIASVVGLGRLTRRALQPLVRNAISHPYDRKMRAQYRPDIMSMSELIRAYLAPRFDSDLAKQYMTQHGFSDQQIAEMIEQNRPRLNSHDWELLQALGTNKANDSMFQDVAEGAQPEVSNGKLQVHTWKRLEPLRNRLLSTMLSQVHEGFQQPSDMAALLARLQLPQDEAQLWRDLAGLSFERTAKRLSHGDMLFLYEAAQITDLEVEDWARAERYSENDVQNLLTVFRLKAAAAATTKTGGSAARTAHLHKEHVAYVTDEITGLWGRSPTAAELNYWVNLIDTGERTKHDFLTELKALDTNGPAIPPS